MATRPLVLLKVLAALAWLALAGHAAARADGVRRGPGRGGRPGGSSADAAAPPGAGEAPSERNPE